MKTIVDCRKCEHARPGYDSILCAQGERKPIDCIFARGVGAPCGPDGRLFKEAKHDKVK